MMKNKLQQSISRLQSAIKNFLGLLLMNIMCWCGSKLFNRVNIYAPKNFVQGITFSNDKKFINYVNKYEKKKK